MISVDKRKKGKGLRILMLNYEFPPLGGGAGNATYYLLKEFSKKKELEIDLVTSSTGKFRKEKFSSNITIHYLDIGKKGNLQHQSIQNLLGYSRKSLKYSKGLMKTKDYSLCHAFFGVPCGYIAMRLGLPYIISLRGSDVPGHNPKFKTLDKLFLKRVSMKVWKKARAVIANSFDLKKDAEKLSSKKVDVIPNGVDIKIYKKTRKKENKEFVVLYVGRLSKVKGIDLLVRAFAKVDGKKKLVVVGGGKLKEELVKMSKELGIKKEIEFAGILDKKKLVKRYNEADVYVLPSLHEGMSNTLLEAMSCSLPVVVTNTGGAKDLVKENGLVLKSGDIRGLTEALVKLKKDVHLRKNMGKKSRKIVEGMSWGNVANDYLEAYGK